MLNLVVMVVLAVVVLVQTLLVLVVALVALVVQHRVGALIAALEQEQQVQFKATMVAQEILAPLVVMAVLV
jgi:hypothetical protein